MFFRVHILYLDEGQAVYNHTAEQREATLTFIKEICEKYNFTYTIVPLEAIYDVSSSHDMRAADAETVKLIEEEKKTDEAVHSVPDEKLKEVSNQIVQIENIEGKRKQLQDLL